MKKKLLWSDFLIEENHIAIHYETKNEADNLLNSLSTHGKMWLNGESLLSNSHFSDRRETIYYIHDNKIAVAYGKLRPSVITIYKIGDAEFIDDAVQ